MPGTRARSWYLGAQGKLSARPASSASADSFTWSPHARPATSFTGPDNGAPGGLWTATPSYHWESSPPGTAAAYVNIGGVVYKGIEAQATWALGNGIALYGNGSSNQAESVDTGKAIKTAIENSIAAGISFVIAAGNQNINACGNPFSQIASASRVGAVDEFNDARSPTSNWGSCIDLWARCF